MYAAVFDGHGGWQVSDFASRRLVDAAEHEFDGISRSGSASEMSPQADSSNATVAGGKGPAAKVLIKVFEELDSDYAQIVLPAFQQGFSGVNRVGSCAIAAILEDSGRALTVANGESPCATLLTLVRLGSVRHCCHAASTNLAFNLLMF